ncbi:cullin-4-like protein [Trifolium pratense]|uniref:Cullin-4-like protein n=1 Tax=Trifolium pratense TaxID=57577 RepID=A0A2K3NNV1_TRIPR|nr:cullin-4-like protein [Trifolium pratense]
MSLPTKRSVGATSIPMKKAKSHDDDDDAVLDHSSLDHDLKPNPLSSSNSMAANLSRKKATPPQPSQPAKKLLIKLTKDSELVKILDCETRSLNLFGDCDCVKLGKPKIPPNFEEQTWATLKSAICAIFFKQPNSCDLEKLYQAVEDLCIHKMGGNLYQRIEKECEVHISAALQSLVGQSPDLVVFLSLVERCWQDHCDQMLMIRDIALFLDRTYVKQNSSIRSLWDMGLQLFRKHLSLSPEVQHKTVTGLLRMIDSER